MTLLIDGSGLDTISCAGLNGAIELIRREFIVDMKLNLITYCPEDLKKRAVDELQHQQQMSHHYVWEFALSRQHSYIYCSLW